LACDGRAAYALRDYRDPCGPRDFRGLAGKQRLGARPLPRDRRPVSGLRLADVRFRAAPALIKSAKYRENGMPEVVVYLAEGRSLDQKRGLVKEITDAVVKNCAVKPEAVTVSIMETPKTNKAKGGVLFSER